MIPKATLCLLASLLAFGQSKPKMAPVPSDPLELATGSISVASTPEARTAALDLLTRARNNFALRNSKQGYDLKISFTADSQGQTDYDGAWQMEDLFVPGQGLHWSAQASAGFTITGIAVKGETYAEGTSNTVPLRLEEARGVVLHPLPSADYASGESIRTSSTTFHGASVTCVLLSSPKRTSTSKKVPNPHGRAWDESEECIDPQSGLLEMHSEVPGRYAVYDYSNAFQLGGHTLPRAVTISEAGRVVSKISVDKLEETPAADANLFTPSDSMKAKGRAVDMTAAKKVTRVHSPITVTAKMTIHPVCVFGMVTPTGQLVEAHSLQPSDPNSQAAIEDAKQIGFSPTTPAGASPRQHFVFVIEKFISQ